MGFQTGLSGLNVSAKNLDVIGNNVANANTVGFKGSRPLFADVYASSLTGAGSSQIGIGTKVSKIQQEFTQGNVSVTNNPLDVAINGGGFFRLVNNGATSYSRNGQFHIDDSGFIVSADKLQLTGYPVDPSGIIIQSAPQPLVVSTANIAPRSTSDFEATLNLDSRATTVVPAFSPTDPLSYTSATSGSVYDSLGNSHMLTMFFVKTATPGRWLLQATVDGGPATAVNLGAGAGSPITLNFNSSGVMTTAMPMAGVTLAVGGGAVTPLTFDLDFRGATQFGSDFGVSALTQDGYATGRLTGFSIGEDGIMLGRYSNGQAARLGQMVLANFANPSGLRAMGNNQWVETSDSGLAVVGAPRTAGLGSLQSASVEDSNVDLTQELVNMITAQRIYQANAQTIKAQDQMLQTLVNLR